MLKDELINDFNALKIEGMGTVTDLNILSGAYINLSYPLPSGESVKLWDDNKTYFGNQMHKENSERCYGLVADENFMLVCEYGDDGVEPEIVIFKRRG
ncbi:MAG: hypothetical protein GX061_08550 [Eubacteriaceae bacterium]|nr:hypothetical protein [Eubacteriaceae bacterium]